MKGCETRRIVLAKDMRFGNLFVPLTFARVPRYENEWHGYPC